MVGRNNIYMIYILKEKKVPQRCPLGTIASNGTGTLFSLKSRGHIFQLWPLQVSMASSGPQYQNYDLQLKRDQQGFIFPLTRWTLELQGCTNGYPQEGSFRFVIRSPLTRQGCRSLLGGAKILMIVFLRVLFRYPFFLSVCSARKSPTVHMTHISFYKRQTLQNENIADINKA